jgi:hypothetical protein
MGIGVPIGIACAHRPRLYAAMVPVLDLMQTLPTFVYLIPAIVFFGLGMVPGLIATVIFVLPAPIRLTHLGVSLHPEPRFSRPPPPLAPPRQRLWKVELPWAMPQARRHLEALAAMPDPELNVLVMDMMRTYDLRLMHTVSNHDNTAYAPLYMPSTGMFRTIVRDHGCLSGHSIGLGLPIDVTCALIATPTERHGNLEMAPTRKALSSASIGTSTARRVVLVPGLYEQDGEERLRGMLRELRRNNDTLIEITDEKRRLVRAAFAETGIDVGRDAAGRIPPGSRR